MLVAALKRLLDRTTLVDGVLKDDNIATREVKISAVFKHVSMYRTMNTPKINPKFIY